MAKKEATKKVPALRALRQFECYNAGDVLSLPENEAKRARDRGLVEDVLVEVPGGAVHSVPKPEPKPEAEGGGDGGDGDPPKTPTGSANREDTSTASTARR